MWVEGEVGITRVIFPPKGRCIIEIQGDQTKRGGVAAPQARFYLSGLELGP